ncbi:hypothetical protein WBG78_20165 [Chryseolinea sp. T2]|uniref:hypothetical protein n=1 Tax=Chryseolinea sp. T2 TaxID=3129255 RepID=UPI0030776DBB
MIKSIARYILLIAIPYSGWAQHMPANMMNAGAGTNITDHMLIMDSRKSVNPPDIVIEGSPYSSPDFASAFIRAKRGTFNDVPARYNAADDNLEYQLKGTTYVVMPTPNIMLVKFDTYSMIVDKLASRDNSYAFYIRLDSGKATLLMRKPIQFKDAVAPKAIETEGKPARYVEKQVEYYIKVDNEIPRPFNNPKKLVAMLPDHQQELEKFISDNKISKNPQELTKLVAYYNSL